MLSEKDAGLIRAAEKGDAAAAKLLIEKWCRC